MDHDRLFKELLTTFFVEFLELFYPDVVPYLDRDSLEFLDKEVFTDVTSGQRHEVDVLVKARFRDQQSFFLVHLETQAQPQVDFARRMFKYFARLHEKFDLPVYPVVLFSYDEPQRVEPDEYRITFPDWDVLTFRFRVLQLNRLDWHDFVQRTNPVAAALMSKMRRDSPEQRPAVKLACLQLLAALPLDHARRELISGFIDAYLQLTMDEEQQFQTQLTTIEPQQREQVMEIVTSWMQKGIEQGLEQGKRQEALTLVLRMLRKRWGTIVADTEARVDKLSVEQLELLGEALLDFTSASDLAAWLDSVGTRDR